MLYIFCDSDNGVATPGTKYQTTSTWPANSDRWLSIVTAVADATITTLADDLTILIQGTADFTAVNLAPSAALIGAGIGPSSDPGVPTTDIAGNSRSGTTTTAGAAMYIAYNVSCGWLVA